MGTIDSAPVYPRIVAKTALQYNAASVILAHNHPSGSCIPSHFDKKVTKDLVKSLKLIDVKVLDHIIIGDGPPVSLAEMGLL